MSKKTEWYPASVKPKRIGIYEVKRFRIGGAQMKPHMLMWTGSRWEYAYRFELMSEGQRASMTDASTDLWRGLAAPSGTEPSDVSQRRG